jgi:hypothetical protein
MTKKKVFLTVIALILAVSTIAATITTNVYPLKLGQSADFGNGRAGIAFTNSKMAGSVHVARKDTSKVKGVNPPQFTQNLLDVRLTDNKGQRVNFVVGPVNVYFKLRGPEVRMYNDGQLGIFYYSDYQNKWVACPSSLINKRDGPRLTCRIRVFGLYGIGTANGVVVKNPPSGG